MPARSKLNSMSVSVPETISYFMTIPEAAQLVIQAGAMGEGDDVVTNCNNPLKSCSGLNSGKK